MSKQAYVYILTNKNNTVLYTGVSSQLEQRIYQHKNKLIEGFTKKYNCTKLVWFIQTDDIVAAITEEKRIKAGSRRKKEELIEAENPDYLDLSGDWF